MKIKMGKLLKMILFLPLLPIMGVLGGAEGAPAGAEGKADDGDGKKPEEGTEGGTDKTTSDKTHTQADVDKAVKDRVSREQKKYQKMIDDMKKTMGGEEGAGTPPADGTEGADPAIQKATAQMLMANTRLIQATALSEAIKLGVDPKYTADVVRLAEMSAIEVAEDGTMDTAAISKAIDEVIKRVPVFKLSAEGAGGFKVGGEGQKGSGTKSGWGSPQKADNVVAGNKRWNNQNR